MCSSDLSSGKDVKIIRLATGWERGADKEWRYEVLDGKYLKSPSQLASELLEFDSERRRNPEFLDLKILGEKGLAEYKALEAKERVGKLTEKEKERVRELEESIDRGRKELWPSIAPTLGDFYDAPEVYRAYPNLRNIVLLHDEGLSGTNTGGYYSRGEHTIYVNAHVGGKFLETALVHELQHVIQEIEGFAEGQGQGASYPNSAGEVEARNAQSRFNMTARERRQKLLAETEDVLRGDQHVFRQGLPNDVENIEDVIVEQADVIDEPTAPEFTRSGEARDYGQQQLKIDPIASKYVKETESSRNVPIDKLHKTEPLDLDAAERARQKMQEAEKGGREKRSPLIVADRGDGTYSIIDGNNTFENLRELGARNVPVTIVPAPYQKHVTNLESLYARNAEVQTEFSDLLRSWQGEVGGELKMRKKLKSEERIREKVEADYNGEYHSVLDVLAGSLVFDSAEQMTEAFDKLKDKAEVVRIKNKWTHPDSTGYRDVNLNIRLSNGTLAELQLHHRGIMEAKDGLGHLLYEFIRKNKAKDEMIPFTRQAEEISRAVYDAGIRGTLPYSDRKSVV